ncbi:hypothetical protein J2Z21_008459 [Streptomyces griseochromogenes]|uniref:Uncharacterized protein n=1 Tax=Streptomyces griseochromogenes TaxID=68214 RepID=A0ABS4M721_9ACTN|nr:hypothetical protein [Streptomyces griseochromogenes]MBP2055445.1 hypothetical protein [Streptomyces griseochromogenes]
MLTIHLSRHDPAAGANPDAQLLSSFLTAVDAGPHGDVASVAAFSRASKTSPAVAAWVRRDEVPELVVDRLMSQLVVVDAAGALIDDRTCRVGLRSTFERLDNEHGVLLTMRSETAAPVELFPALLHCWMWWWRKQVEALSDRPEMPSPPERTANADDFAVQLAQWLERAKEMKQRQPAPNWNVPLPPERLDLVEDGRRFIVRLEDFELTSWPDAPQRDRGDLYFGDMPYFEP